MAYFFLFLSFITASLQQSDLSEARQLYLRSAEEEAAAEELLQFAEAKQDKPLFLGYKAAAEMMLAKHVINPLSKMSHFNRGKKAIAKAIEAKPSSLELRFLRFSVQSETPDFLGYKDNLEEDKKILFSGIESVKDVELKRMILEFMTVARALNEVEKQKMKNRLLESDD